MQANKTLSFIETQHRFTQYIRNPDKATVPADIEKRRIDIYRDLFFNNISGMLSDGFPVLKQILPEQQWETLCRDFFTRHQCHSPYFSEVSQEFIQYLQTECPENSGANKDFPFLLELAHYEWTELFVSIAEEDVQSDEISDPMNQILTVASTALALAYTYPVHKISSDFLPTEAPEQATCLVVYRTADNNTGFLETTPMTHTLLVALTDNEQLTTHALLSQLAEQLQHPNPDVVIEGGLTILEDFISRGIIVPA